jgi:hypothetical protein
VAAQAPPSCIMMLTLHMASLGRMETGGRRALEREPGHGATAVAVTRMLAQAAVTGILLPRHRSAAVMTRPPRVACATSGPGYFLSLASGQPRATQVKKVPVSDFRSKAYQ